MLLRRTDPELYITEYTFVYEDKKSFSIAVMCITGRESYGASSAFVITCKSSLSISLMCTTSRAHRLLDHCPLPPVLVQVAPLSPPAYMGTSLIRNNHPPRTLGKVLL